MIKEFCNEINSFAKEVAKDYRIEEQYVKVIMQHLLINIEHNQKTKDMKSKKYREEIFNEVLEICSKWLKEEKRTIEITSEKLATHPVDYLFFSSLQKRKNCAE